MIKLSEHIFNGFVFSTISGDDAPIEIASTIYSFLEIIDISGKNVIDGGSNYGLYSLEFARRVGDNGMVYAFELQDTICGISRLNFAANGIKNIFAAHNAISDKSGEWVGFTDIDYYAEKLSSGGIRTEPLLIRELVETIAVDDLGLKNVGLIKLDIEGGEPKALDGMWQTIDKQKPYMIIELSDGYLGEDAVIQTISNIEAHGYTYTKDNHFNYFFTPIFKP